MTQTDTLKSPKTIIIGDVHGCVVELDKLLDKCQFNKDLDEIIFVGDLINKGPDSLGVLNMAESLGAKKVIGNHELAFIAYARIRHQFDPGEYPEWEDLIIKMGDQLTQWIEKIEEWPTFIERENYIVVHGGLIPERHPREEDREILVHMRTWDGVGRNLNRSENPPWHSLYRGQKTVIYGHWAAQGLHLTKNTVGLDSGCVYGGKLSAYLWPQQKIVQVAAENNYTPIHPKSSPTPKS